MKKRSVYILYNILHDLSRFFFRVGICGGKKVPPFRQWGNSVRKTTLFNREGDEFNNVFLNAERISGRNTVTALVAVGIYKALFRDM